jgi:hypothetical protein
VEKGLLGNGIVKAFVEKIRILADHLLQSLELAEKSG